MNKVTKLQVKYPAGAEPNLVIPQDYRPYRFALGRPGQKTGLVIGMNPSAAREEASDRTVNKVIKHLNLMGYDGWLMTNLYPERATDASLLDDFDASLMAQNISTILDLCQTYQITEIWGAWGDQKHPTLQAARQLLLQALTEADLKVYYFGSLTKAGNPRHPLYLKIDGHKHYLTTSHSQSKVD